MIVHRWFLVFVLASTCCAASARGQHRPASQNAALRYWSAFSVMQDSAITREQAAQLTAILDGKARYDDSAFAGLIKNNQLSLQIMARAAALPVCDWGLDPSFGSEEPVEYARKALVLGRLNVLYALHLMSAGDPDAAATTLAAGLQFSRQVANGGTLFATLVSDVLISQHLRAVSLVAGNGKLSAAQRAELQRAVARLGTDGVDWASAIDREFQVLRGHFQGNAQALAALTRIDSAYTQALKNPSKASALEQAIHAAPDAVTQLIPIPRRVIENKQALTAQIARARSSL